MKGIITMSNKEANRIPVLEKLLNKELKQKKAAEMLGVSPRQVRRLVKRYRLHKASGLIHGNRGRESNNKIKVEEIDRVLRIVQKKYYDFGPTLAHEKLIEAGEIKFSVEKLRQAMIAAGMWKAKRKKYVQIHTLRERRAMEGELVQVDGSPHDWFEGRAEIRECTLLVFIDDATGKLLWLEFVVSESTNSYFIATKHYLRVCGKPMALYSDKHGVFRVNTAHNGSGSTNDSNGLTQYGRALWQLGIELIPASCCQAKGRVEKANRTLQDRLVKELRLQGINNMVEANRFLPKFIADYNRKFAVIPKSSVNAHRPVLANENLDSILCQYHTRIVAKDLTVHYKNRIYQIPITRSAYILRKATIIVKEDPDGNVILTYNGKTLEYTILKLQPKAEIVDSKNLNSKLDQLRNASQPLTFWEKLADQQWEGYATN